LQEAISNALKHAHASNIWVNVLYLPDQNLLRLSVTDDGVGIPQKPQQGRGLNNMQQRAREIGAGLYISDQTLGTQVVCELKDL
jgi:signal transduction histidine kinase